MLQDEVRTNAYKNIIYAAKEYFTGKVVMDVGAGTGELVRLNQQHYLKCII